MGFLARLRAWWHRRAWSRSDAGAAGAGGPADYECAVCGTGVDDADGSCPLCRGTDVVPAGANVDDDRDADGGAEAESGAAAVDRRRVTPADEESVERLRRLRAEDELLERYADRWRPVDGGFRVETRDGTRVVDSRDEVVAMLRAEDG